MKTLAIIIPPRRLNTPMLLRCLGLWRKAYNLRIFSLRTRHPELTDYAAIQTENLEALDDASFDAIAVMDGPGTKEYLWDDQTLIAQIQRFDKTRKLVAGIGYGSVVLAQSGLLLGKQATTTDTLEMIVQLKSYGAIFNSEDVVILKWIITGNGRNVEAFADAVSGWLRQPEC